MNVNLDELYALLGQQFVENYALRREIVDLKRALEAALPKPVPEPGAP